jgi:hypothetical protein
MQKGNFQIPIANFFEQIQGQISMFYKRNPAKDNSYNIKSSVGDPDPLGFGPPGYGSVSQRYGSGSFPFLIKGVERTEIMPAK